MGVRRCCVVHCPNNSRDNKNVKFYLFPTIAHKQNQRIKWINAVKRINSDGKPWIPLSQDVICSAHFMGNSKSDIDFSPSYAPTIFPSAYKKKNVNEKTALSRFQRQLQRVIKSREITEDIPIKNQCIVNNVSVECQVEQELTEYVNDESMNDVSVMSVECQVDFPSLQDETSKLFVCNRYVNNNINDAEIQTEICFKNEEFFNKNISVSISSSEQLNQCLHPSDEQENIKQHVCKSGFLGFESIKKNDEMIDIAGVSMETFNLFARKYNPSIQKTKVSPVNRLLIFFMKMKLGLSYSSLSVLFGLHRTTISRIFIGILHYLSAALKNEIRWLDKDIIQGTMPECFKPDYSDVTVIIDCTEFPIETPHRVDQRVCTWSHYKKGFTAKALIGCAPSGLITFRSKVSGGRKSDTQITVESQFINYLQDGDKVLADKGFPEIRKKIAEDGKQVILIVPPFLRNPEFTAEEAEETYRVANVRIHIERIMQRIKLFKIMDKIPATLFPYIDDVFQVICVLVNLQPPIISTNHKESDIE